MQEHAHVREILEEAKIAVDAGDIMALNNISNRTIHSATIYQDTDNVLVAVIVYSLAKLLERKDKYNNKSFDKYLDFYLKTIDYFISCFDKDNCKLFRSRIDEIMEVPGLSKELKESVKDVFHKARINKASKIYEHGVSMEATSRLLGVSLWELAEYTGQGYIADLEIGKTKDVKHRIKKVMEFFK